MQPLRGRLPWPCYQHSLLHWIVQKLSSDGVAWAKGMSCKPPSSTEAAGQAWLLVPSSPSDSKETSGTNPQWAYACHRA